MVETWDEFIEQLKESNDIFDHPERWPRSIEEAMNRIVSGLSDEVKQNIGKANDVSEVSDLYISGAGIRNGYGMWAGNQALLDSCGCTEPDDASEVIIEAVWNRLREK